MIGIERVGNTYGYNVEVTHEDGMESSIESNISSSQVITDGICPRDKLSIEVLYETKLKERKASNA